MTTKRDAETGFRCPKCDAHDYAGCQLEVERCPQCDAYASGYRQGRWEMLCVLVQMVDTPPDHHAPGSCACEPCRIYVLTRAGKKAEALDKAKALIADQEAAFAYAMNCAAHGGSGHCRYTTCPCWTVEYCDSECHVLGRGWPQERTAGGSQGEYFHRRARGRATGRNPVSHDYRGKPTARRGVPVGVDQNSSRREDMAGIPVHEVRKGPASAAGRAMTMSGSRCCRRPTSATRRRGSPRGSLSGVSGASGEAVSGQGATEAAPADARPAEVRGTGRVGADRPR